MIHIADVLLLIVSLAFFSAGVAAGGYGTYWLYERMGLWVILVGPFAFPVGPVGALIASLPLTWPLLAIVQGNPRSWLTEDI